jgi:hypothetical protein
VPTAAKRWLTITNADRTDPRQILDLGDDIVTYNYLTLIALDVARERTLEADRHRLARLATAGRPGFTRRAIARVAAAFSVGAAGVARRLDEHALDVA